MDRLVWLSRASLYPVKARRTEYRRRPLSPAPSLASMRTAVQNNEPPPRSQSASTAAISEVRLPWPPLVLRVAYLPFHV
jgi:hypothetical protein